MTMWLDHVKDEWGYRKSICNFMFFADDVIVYLDKHNLLNQFLL